MKNRDNIFALIKKNKLEKIKLLFENKTNDEKINLFEEKSDEKFAHSDGGKDYFLRPLEYALCQDNLDSFKELLSYLDCNKKDHYAVCARAILISATAGKWQPFQMILDKVTEKNSKEIMWGDTYNTVAHVIVKSGSLEMLNLWLDKCDADFIAKKNKKEQSSIVLAATLGHFTLVQALIDFFLKENKKSKVIDDDLLDEEDCISILKYAYASKTDELDIIKTIFASHGFGRKDTLPWMTFLLSAIENEHVEQVQSLVRTMAHNKIQMNLLEKLEDKQILQILNFSCKNQQWEVTKLLLDNIKCLSKTGSVKRNYDTALLYAVQHGQYVVAELLLKNGQTKLNQVHVEYGNEFLYHAITNNRVDLVELLLKYKADLNQRNSQGQTALEFAQSLNHLECANVLEKAQNKKQSSVLSTVTSLFKTVVGSKKPERSNVLTNTKKSQDYDAESLSRSEYRSIFLTQPRFIANQSMQNDASNITLEPIYEHKQNENNAGAESLKEAVSNFRGGVSRYY